MKCRKVTAQWNQLKTKQKKTLLWNWLSQKVNLVNNENNKAVHMSINIQLKNSKIGSKYMYYINFVAKLTN